MYERAQCLAQQGAIRARQAGMEAEGLVVADERTPAATLVRLARESSPSWTTRPWSVPIMPVELLLERVAQRAGLDVDGARRAQAVFATLREALINEEFLDVTLQLPHEYATILPRR